MVQLLLLTVGALVVGSIGFGVVVLVSGADQGLQPVEPDGRALALPASRPLVESDFGRTRFDTAIRGYRMAQVDTALRRAAYDIGYKQELIGVLEAEVTALREGRADDADALRSARESALRSIADGPADPDSGGEKADIEPIDFEAVEVDTAATKPADIELGDVDDRAADERDADDRDADEADERDADEQDVGLGEVDAVGGERAHRPEETRLS